jgi:hypothetical protein
MSTETLCYQDKSGFIRRFKVSVNNPRDFKVGDKFIVVGESKKPETVESEHRAKKLNESIVFADKIRRFFM